MKRSYFTLLACSLLIIFAGCKTSKPISLESYKGKKLIIGNSGGATGAILTWYILDNGKIYVTKSIQDEPKELKKLPKSTTNSLFEKAQALELSKDEFNHPGNMTYFIEFVSPPAPSNKIKWGDNAFNVPEKYLNFYKETLSIIQSK